MTGRAQSLTLLRRAGVVFTVFTVFTGTIESESTRGRLVGALRLAV